jgi:predicted nucleic acid-binding Zn finger protein
MDLQGITALRDGYLVLSQTAEDRAYLVVYQPNLHTCSCPDFLYRHAGKGTLCKHLQHIATLFSRTEVKE